MRTAVFCTFVCVVVVVPLALAMTSPLLQWRTPVYIGASFAGILGMSFIALQPLLISHTAWPFVPRLGRRLHRAIGVGIVTAILVHVAALWMTSPPDVLDALFLRSPTAFSIWGVLAMWAAILTAAYAMMRKRLRPWVWRWLHLVLAGVIIGGTIAHVLLIEGTMEQISKLLLSAVLVLAFGKLVYDLRPR